jgi:hypothetical protein
MTATHRIQLPALLLAFVTMAGCDAVDRTRARLATPDTAAVATASGTGLALGLQAPGALEAGDEGILRLSLTNRTDTIVSRVRLELIVPGWADPLPPRLGDREVTLAALEDGGTRFSYRLDDTPLEPGQAETIEQRIRVPTSGVVGDATVPWSRAVRARLLDLDGQLLAEVESEISLAGVATNGTPSAAGPVTGPVRDRLGPVRLGMTGPALRQAAPAARDTTWSQEGMEERGLVVPTGGGNALAVLSGDTVVRIDVVDPAVRTAERLGVGSLMRELRAAYGAACAEGAEGRVVVWFPAAPGVSFALDTPVPQDFAELRSNPDRIPETASVTRWWLRRGVDACPR